MVWPSTWLAHIEQRVDLRRLGVALHHPLQHAPHPAGALAARRALAAALACRSRRSRATARIRSVDLSITITAAVPRPDFSVAQRVEIHQQPFALLRRDHRHRRAARDDGLEVAPAAAHAAAMLFEQPSSAGSHISSSILHGLLDVAGDAEHLRAGVVGTAKPANQPAPRRRMVGATAIDSTLLTVVGQP